MKYPILIPNIFNHPFTYDSDHDLEIGDYVFVPFGKSKVTGVVWDSFEKNKNKNKIFKNLNIIIIIYIYILSIFKRTYSLKDLISSIFLTIFFLYLINSGKLIKSINNL